VPTGQTAQQDHGLVHPKGAAKAEVAVVHEKLPGAEAVAEMKACWRERLTAFKQLLES
jgi:hypothetical protein